MITLYHVCKNLQALSQAVRGKAIEPGMDEYIVLQMVVEVMLEQVICPAAALEKVADMIAIRREEVM